METDWSEEYPPAGGAKLGVDTIDVLMVKVPDVTDESGAPAITAMALMVSVTPLPWTGIGPPYGEEDVVGVEPSVV